MGWVTDLMAGGQIADIARKHREDYEKKIKNQQMEDKQDDSADDK